jgi:uncharacterized membrane protein
MIPIYIFLALLIAFLWGIQPVIHKYLLTKFNWFTIMFISSIIYFIALCITLLFSKTKSDFSRDLHNGTTQDFIIIATTSIITVFLVNMIYYYVLKNHETSIISALIYSAPVFTLVISYLFLSERIQLIGIIGILLILSGVFCVSLNNNTSKLFNKYDTIE